jgi:histidinol-phosphate phosphatase family protein
VTQVERKSRPAVFLDRDGTLNVDKRYVASPSDVELVPGAAAGARALADAGFVLVVASNQSGIARGFFTAAQADRVDARIRELLASGGVTIAAFYRCPHLDEGCECRKPRPGMLLQAASELRLDLPRSWTVGDRARDVAAGKAAGCRTVSLPGSPPHVPPEDFSASPPDHAALDLVDAARFIIAHMG